MQIVALVAGVACLVTGLLILHGADIVWTAAHEPKAVAIVDSHACHDVDSDSGTTTLCNMAIHFRVHDQTVHTTMGAIDPSDMATEGSATVIGVDYNPSHPILVVPSRENSETWAWCFAGIGVFVLICSVPCFRAVWRSRHVAPPAR